MTTILRRAHRFCVNHLIYPLGLASFFACLLLAGRVYYSRGWTYNFLLWNLFLAWIPFACSLLSAVIHERYPRAWWLVILPSLLWFIFLPNAPYIVTDWLHLNERTPIPTWFDIGMLAMFAWAGMILGIASLNAMQKIIRDYWGGLISWLFAFSAIGASGLGIYLGRFLGWNSWDLFLQPGDIATDIFQRFAHPRQNPGALGFTILFATFMLICYLTFASIEHRQRDQSRSL